MVVDNDIADILEYCRDGEESFADKDYPTAAYSYKQCWDVFSNSSADRMLLNYVAVFAYYARRRNKMIFKKYLDDCGFDMEDVRVV